MAAFCEVLREVGTQWERFDSAVRERLLALFYQFDEELVYERINDSDGLHVFSQAHINALLGSG